MSAEDFALEYCPEASPLPPEFDAADSVADVAPVIRFPRMIDTELAQLSDLTRRECDLVRQRTCGKGLTFDEATELLRIQRQQQINAQAQASDLAHDMATEARSFQPDRFNFHDA